MSETMTLTPAQHAEIADLRTQVDHLDAIMASLEDRRSRLIDEIDAIETPDLGSVPDGTDDLPEHYLVR